MFDLVIQGLIISYHTLVTYPHFTKSCCIAAFCLFYFSNPEYKTCLKILFFEFLACQLAATFGIDLTRILNPWGIYAVSGVVQLSAMVCLFVYQHMRYKVSSVLTLLVALAGFVNIELALCWHGQGFTGLTATYLYNIYADLLGGIMLLQLLFMFFCNRRDGRNGYRYNIVSTKRRFVEALFFVYSWVAVRHINR